MLLIDEKWHFCCNKIRGCLNGPNNKQLLKQKLYHVKCRVKAVSFQAWTGPWDPRTLRFQEFLYNRPIKLAKLSALRTGRLYFPGDIPGTPVCQRLGRPQNHSAAGKVKPMKSPNDPVTESIPWPSGCYSNASISIMCLITMLDSAYFKVFAAV
jgi:hypothetical protein